MVIHTDGACSGNPGPGGWGAILEFKGTREGAFRRRAGDDQQPHGADRGDRGAVGAEAALASSSFTPIPNICGTASPTWINGWKRNGWRTRDRKPVKNVELWQTLEALIEQHKVDWRWVRGHAGHDLNERADALARTGMAPFLKRRVSKGA